MIIVGMLLLTTTANGAQVNVRRGERKKERMSLGVVVQHLRLNSDPGIAL